MTGEIWFLTGSQHLYGEDVLRQVAQHSREIVRGAGRLGDDPGAGSVQGRS